MTSPAGPITVYRSSDPAAVGAFDRARSDANAFDAALERFFEYHPEVSDDQLRVRHSGGRTRVAGFAPRPEQERRRAPKGWCRDNYGLFVPSTTSGREIQMALDALPACYTVRHYLEADAGMPSMHLAGDPFRGARLLSPGAALRPGPLVRSSGETVDGLVYVRWNTHLTSEFDAALPAHWERVALSAYFELVESGRDPFQPGEPVDGQVP